jgi:hypothetical protein
MNMSGKITKVYMVPSIRKTANDFNQIGSGVTHLENAEYFYLSRAVSSVPDKMKPVLEEQYKALIEIVKKAGGCPRLPFELEPGADKREINPANHMSLHTSRWQVPLTYAVSDGRGWEMGYAYKKKGLIPLVLRGQKKNTPTIRLPFQVPIIFDDLTEGDEAYRLKRLFKFYIEHDVGLGKCADEKHQDTLVGFRGDEKSCLKCAAEDHGFELVPVDFSDEK